MGRKKSTLKVAELFAGVGGFRVGLERVNEAMGQDAFQVVWSDQWEPSTKVQHASDIYVQRFGGKGHCNEDISTVETDRIPDHDLMVGGFPCQDYSVATTLKNSGGLIGRKGVLWWQIQRILEQKENKPKYLMLENVDRLLKSPASQRGRDFAVMLSSMNKLGYAIEWRVVNAADYGMPQRRRRIFIMGYHKSTAIYKKIAKLSMKEEWLLKTGVVASAFPVTVPSTNKKEADIFGLEADLVKISTKFNKNGKTSPFQNTGLMVDGNFWTMKTLPVHDGPNTKLGDVLLPEKEVSKDLYVVNGEHAKWEYLKGAKNEKRYNKANDFWYTYNEGPMVFPDALDRASRTIITGEGGRSPSRFKHVIRTPKGRLRRLAPIELERLNMFPDNHTEGASDVKRAFFMGNALVVGVVEKLGEALVEAI